MTIEESKAVVKGIFPKAESLYGIGTTTGSFEVRHRDLTFERLEKLSQGLKTKEINFCIGSITQGCESCGHGSDATVEVHVKGIGSLA